MNWHEFLIKLNEARDQGKDKKISVPVLAALIFCGAFDSMISDDMYLPGENNQINIRVYTLMFEQIKAVKKSKANLPKKKKGEFIGLNEVNNMLKLSMWRSQRTPIVKSIDFSDLLANDLQHRGFERVNKNGSIFKFIRGADPKNGKAQVLGTPHWRKVFADNRLALFADDRQLMIYGVISDVRILKYGPAKDKERLVFKIFTGYEMTDDFVMWPSRKTGELNAAYKEQIHDGATGFCLVRPSLYNNKPTGTVNSFVQLSL